VPIMRFGPREAESKARTGIADGRGARSAVGIRFPRLGVRWCGWAHRTPSPLTLSRKRERVRGEGVASVRTGYMGEALDRGHG